MALGAFIGSFILIHILFHNIIISASIALLPSFALYAVTDVVFRMRKQQEKAQITRLLTSMAKSSLVRNDMVYCFGKTLETGIEKPTHTLIEKAVGRINGGMDIILAIRHIESECKSEEMKYMFRNIRFAAEKGGNLRNLFTSMEKQFFMIDEEFFKRKISTSRDRTAVYFTVLMVIASAVWFLVKNSTAGEFYIHTGFGNSLLLIFSIAFSLALVLMFRE
jgi:Flp pilus assembly protein TadB